MYFRYWCSNCAFSTQNFATLGLTLDSGEHVLSCLHSEFLNLQLLPVHWNSPWLASWLQIMSSHRSGSLCDLVATLHWSCHDLRLIIQRDATIGSSCSDAATCQAWDFLSCSCSWFACFCCLRSFMLYFQRLAFCPFERLRNFELEQNGCLA